MASQSLTLGTGSLRALVKKAQHLQARAKTAREKSEGLVEGAVETVETVGGAYAMGLVQGRFPTRRDIMGVPLELATGAALIGASLLGLAGRSSHHLHAFGNGALAAYAVKAGQDMGKKWASKAGVSGYLDDGDVLSDNERADIAE
jgi:hypothetical protein